VRVVFLLFTIHFSLGTVFLCLSVAGTVLPRALTDAAISCQPFGPEGGTLISAILVFAATSSCLAHQSRPVTLDLKDSKTLT